MTTEETELMQTLFELAQVFKSYLEDDSRSPRRRQACLAEVKAILSQYEIEVE